MPTESFAEAIAFLRLFDLSALAVTDALCSSLAVKASTKIRWEQFPGLELNLGNHFIEIFRTPGPNEVACLHRLHVVTRLSFSSFNDMSDFVAAAFPNCIFDDVVILMYAGQHLLDAIARVADCVIVNGVICLPYKTTHCYTHKLVRKFRKVAVCVS